MMLSALVIALGAQTAACWSDSGGSYTEPELQPIGKADQYVDLLQVPFPITGTNMASIVASALRKGLPGGCMLDKLNVFRADVWNGGYWILDFGAVVYPKPDDDDLEALNFQDRFFEECVPQESTGSQICHYMMGDEILSNWQAHVEIDNSTGRVRYLESFYWNPFYESDRVVCDGRDTSN